MHQLLFGFRLLALLPVVFVHPVALGDGPPVAALPKTGEQVYWEVCSACHATGVNHAPRFGDRKRWAQLAEEGQAIVTAHGWVGVRAMPPRGGQPGLTLESFARAVVWMAGGAGIRWQAPDATLMAAIREEENKRMQKLAKH